MHAQTLPVQLVAQASLKHPWALLHVPPVHVCSRPDISATWPHCSYLATGIVAQLIQAPVTKLLMLARMDTESQAPRVRLASRLEALLHCATAHTRSTRGCHHEPKEAQCPP